MYKLVLDKSYLPLYSDFYPESSLKQISGDLYKFLQAFSRPIVSSIFGESFIPVKMLVSIRTDLTNELIVPNSGKFYTDCTSDYPNEHPLDDTILLAAQKLVLKLFDCGTSLPMYIQRTTLYPVGVCLIDGSLYVYVNVVIDSTLLDDLNFKLRDCTLKGIQTITPENDLETTLLNSLAIVNVKGDNKDACDDN